MRAFLASAFAIAVISVGAYYSLTGMEWTSANKYQSHSNVRLD